MLAETHRFITKHALQFRKKHFRGYEQIIEDACAREDIPKVSLDPDEFQLFGTDHFYNPELKAGYSRFSGNAKDKGMMLFRKALELYKKKDYKMAFRSLGRSIHYLQDVASPSHTKLYLHLEEDDFEIYVDQNIHKFRFRIMSRIVPPMKPAHCFESLARKSYRIEYRKKNWFISSLWNIIFRRKQQDPDRHLNRIGRRMVKLSIIYSIALLNAFNRKIVRYSFSQKQKRLSQRLKAKEKKIVRKIRAKSKDLVS